VFHFVPYLQGYRSGLNDMGWRNNGDLLNTPREHFRQSLEGSPTFMLEPLATSTYLYTVSLMEVCQRTFCLTLSIEQSFEYFDWRKAAEIWSSVASALSRSWKLPQKTRQQSKANIFKGDRLLSRGS
jgi:hypothetical protein